MATMEIELDADMQEAILEERTYIDTERQLMLTNVISMLVEADLEDRDILVTDDGKWIETDSYRVELLNSLGEPSHEYINCKGVDDGLNATALMYQLLASEPTNLQKKHREAAEKVDSIVRTRRSNDNALEIYMYIRKRPEDINIELISQMCKSIGVPIAIWEYDVSNNSAYKWINVCGGTAREVALENHQTAVARNLDYIGVNYEPGS